MTWIHEEYKLNCHISVKFLVGDLPFRKQVVILEHNSNNLISVFNKAKQRINDLYNQIKTMLWHTTQKFTV